MEGYQVSNQCMALVRDNCFVPTKDAPELGYIRESSDKQYVPDVFYKVSKTQNFFFASFIILLHFNTHFKLYIIVSYASLSMVFSLACGHQYSGRFLFFSGKMFKLNLLNILR